MKAAPSVENNGLAALRTWEFHFLVLESFLLVAAEGALWRVVGRTFPYPRVVLSAFAFLVVELTLLPIQTAVARIYYRQDVSVARFGLWALAGAVLFGVLISVVA